ncbi:MAG TPA: MarR family transcriptional regulator [Chitinophaga sp.]|uniref:MarR family winged helix-turn-helix transcriptional regulator n=1 Tax=Chitinophaga sp. TaxID=1869181 RepID=UPI002BC585EE|nr:MarR family transcriptional regulator [Chitinophaga sp.]HVI44402.1 MarR family transcriptional regulator [Chitinophaga sp.]
MKLRKEQDTIGYLLMQICKLRRNQNNALLSESGLHAGQEFLLYHLSQEDGQTISCLVGKMCIQPATISNMIDRMEASGMITKMKDSEDKRSSRVYLTKKGREALGAVDDVWKKLATITTKGLTPTEEATLSKLLQKVLTNLS